MSEVEVEWKNGGRLASVRHNYLSIRGGVGILMILLPMLIFAGWFFLESGALETIGWAF